MNLDQINDQKIDPVDESIYWKDVNGKYLGCNAHMAKMAGIPRNKIIGSTDYFLSWKDQANKLREIDSHVVQTRKRIEMEESVKIAEGIIKAYISSKSPLYNNNGEVIGIIGISIDISHYKQFEREFEKTEIALNDNINVITRC